MFNHQMTFRVEYLKRLKKKKQSEKIQQFLVKTLQQEVNRKKLQELRKKEQLRSLNLGKMLIHKV